MNTKMTTEITEITDINDILTNIMLEKKKLKKAAMKDNDKNNTDKHNTDKDISIDIRCKICNSRHICEQDGFYVCKECGLCNDCIIDSGQEWRFYGADENKGNDPSRCDIPTNDLLPKTSIGALVGFGTKENKTSKT